MYTIGLLLIDGDQVNLNGWLCLHVGTWHYNLASIEHSLHKWGGGKRWWAIVFEDTEADVGLEYGSTGKEGNAAGRVEVVVAGRVRVTGGVEVVGVVLCFFCPHAIVSIFTR